MNKKGFTLAEVTVTLSILGILTAISIPSYISWLPRHRLQTSVRQIYDDMNLAKMQAVRSNTNVCITFTPATPTYTVFLDSNSSGSWNAGETIYKNNVTLENGVTMINPTTFTNDTIGFNNRGMAATPTGQVDLTNPTGNGGVQVTSVGGISAF